MKTWEKVVISLCICSLVFGGVARCVQKPKASTTKPKTEKSQKVETEVKPGQVWEYRIDFADPFKEDIIWNCKILQVKGGYVQYVTQNSFINSECIQDFRNKSKLIGGVK